MARRMKTAQQASQKWKTNTAGATQYYQQGVQNATGWAAGAIAAAPRRNAGLQAAIASGAIDAGIQRAGDNAWRTATLGKGVQNWSAGVAAAQPKYEAGMTKAMAYQQAAEQATAGIDTSTQAGRLQKATVWAQTVSQAARAAKGLH